MITPTFCRSPRWLAPALMFASLLPAGHAATGDLVPICINCDDHDSFAVIALAAIPGGTRYFLTDSGWSTATGTLMQEGNSPSSNRQIQFDVAAGGIPFGTVLRFDQTGANVVLTDPSLGTLTMVARFPAEGTLGTKLSFSNTFGDQLLIYQTAGNTVSGAVTMISALNVSVYTNSDPASIITISNGWQVGGLPQPNQGAATSESNAPGGLVVYNGSNASTATAFGLGTLTVSGGLSAQDNYKYNGSYGFATKAEYLTAINNPANWAANDTAAYDVSTVGPTAAADINLVGNGVSIADGATTPLATDHTLFGAMPVSSGNLARSFTIQNAGTANLNIPAGAITFGGTNPGDFAVSGITLPAVIAPGGSTNFTVTFDPTAAGTRTATVNIVNNDANENPYNFDIRGYGYNYTAPATAAPPLRWSPTVQNSNAGTTRAVGSTTSGDVIAGSKINAFNPGNIRVTRHAAGTGAVVWTRDYDSGNADDINEMIVDPANGDTYIAARASVGTNLNWFVHKVNGDGSHGWTYTFDGGVANSADDCTSITRSSDGNVVVVGAITNGSGSFARVAKINAATGAEMNSYLSGTDKSIFNAVAADASGNVFATGFINVANANALTMKFNSTLGVVWTQTFDGAAAMNDSFANVVVLSNGDCAVGGTTRTSASNSDGIVIRYAAASPGNEIWRNNIVGSVAGQDPVNNLAVDAGGDLYAVGSMSNLTASDRDAYVRKITGSSGATAWTSYRLGSAPELTDRFQNVRVSGSAVYAVGSIENANRNILASRFNASTGAEEWTFSFNGTGNGTDDVFSPKNVMTLLSTDAIAIGGETYDASTNVYGIVLKYAPVVPPTVANVPKSVNEDLTVNFSSSDFTANYTDTNGLALATVRITSLPANGTLKNGATTIAAAPADIAIGSIGSLSFTPATNFNGATSFGWNGSNGTLYATSAATVNLTVTSVNDKPTFTASNPPAVNEDAGAQSIPSYATAFNAGAANESAQTLAAYTVSNISNAALFSAAPAVAANGTLTYTPAANANGSSTFQLRVQDSGGTANGGVDTSDPQTFTITVNSVNDLPAITGQLPIAILEGSSRAIAFADLTVTDIDNTYPTGFTLTASNGTNYTRSGNTITPLPNFAGTLSVPVKVNDGAADSNSYSLVVVVNPTSLHMKKGGKVTFEAGGNRARFIGKPGETYAIQYSDTLLAGSWLPLGTATAGADTLFSILDNNPPSLVRKQRFYRVALPYENDFTGGAGAASFRGTATWLNGAVRLTDAVGGMVNAVVFDDIPATPALNGFVARFNLTIGPAGNPDPADGVNFAVGDLGAIGWGESGPLTASHLSVGFDTYNNGTANGNRGIHVWVNGAHIAVNPTNPFTNGASVPVEISYNVATGLSMTFNGATIFTNLATPGFVFPANGKFGIGARTGGAVETAFVDDVVILPR